MFHIDLESSYKKLTEEDKEVSKHIDFDLKCYDIKNKVEELYGDVFINGAATNEEVAKIDFIYTHIEEVIRQGNKLLSNE